MSDGLMPTCMVLLLDYGAFGLNYIICHEVKMDTLKALCTGSKYCSIAYQCILAQNMLQETNIYVVAY